MPRVACFLVEHWLFGSGNCPVQLVRPLGGCVKQLLASRDGTLVRKLTELGTLLGPEGTAALLGCTSA